MEINVSLGLLAYITDLLFSEPKRLKHPIILMGDYINFYKKRYYKDSVLSGGLLTFSLILQVIILIYLINLLLSLLPHPLYVGLSGLIGSMGLSSAMLKDSVLGVLEAASQEERRARLSMLITRDTTGMDDNEIYKCSIETYSENLSDGLIAPLFYLLVGGLYGLFIYKAISTLDSMVGYKDIKNIRFGKLSAKLDDLLNYIPSRLTALLILLMKILLMKGFKLSLLKQVIKEGKEQESPNAGFPMSAMALYVGVELGGGGYYNDKFKEKGLLGVGGRCKLQKSDVERALSLGRRLDILLLGILILCII